MLVDDASTDADPGDPGRGGGTDPGRRRSSRCPQTAAWPPPATPGSTRSRGRYLTFLDGDDVVAPGYLSQLLARPSRDWAVTSSGPTTSRSAAGARSVHRVSYGPRGIVAPAREGIGPPSGAAAVDAPNAWAGVYSRRLLDAGLLRFDEDLRTCEDRPWIWRLHLQARQPSPWSGCTGSATAATVSRSLTQVADERQFDFMPAFEGIVAAVLADRGCRALPAQGDPVATARWSATTSTQLDRYPPLLRRRLRRSWSADPCAALPGDDARAGRRPAGSGARPARSPPCDGRRVSTQVFVASTAFGAGHAGRGRARTGCSPPPTAGSWCSATTPPMPEIVPGVCPRWPGLGRSPPAVRRGRRPTTRRSTPQHPSGWQPRAVDLPIWERYFGQRWELGDADLHLVVESIQATPALALCPDLRRGPDRRLRRRSDELRPDPDGAAGRRRGPDRAAAAPGPGARAAAGAAQRVGGAGDHHRHRGLPLGDRRAGTDATSYGAGRPGPRAVSGRRRAPQRPRGDRPLRCR